MPASSGRRTVEEHAAVIAALLEPSLSRIRPETVALADALGRVAARPIGAPAPMPPFRNAQMDGFAARAADLAAIPVTLPVVGTRAAARGEPAALEPGMVLRIMTGAPVPDGADCVVPVEETTDAGAGRVTVLRGRSAGEFVREAGSDLAAGSVVIETGTLLAARHIAAIAATGAARVEVLGRPLVAVLTSGSEVVEAGGHRAFGEIYDANRPALEALVVENGAVVASSALVPDDAGTFRAALDAAIAEADLVLTSGGISQGDFEVVRQVLEPLGADVTEIAMQPGGPQATAEVDGVPVICFPGNPVSTQVSFAVFVRPLLRAAAGLPAIASGTATLGTAIRSVPAKRQWLRGVVENGIVHPVSGPSSHLVAGMARADVLIDVPAETLQLAEGARVRVLPL